jgi:pimeloyl-ACP methyl ester carboxylesterase
VAAERNSVKGARGRLRVVPETGTPARRKRAAHKDCQPIPLHKDTIVLHGRTIAYRTGGAGPLLVLIHGITSNSATWDRVLPLLCRQYTVLAPDLLGHGRSDKPRGDYSPAAHANMVRDLLDALGYDRATLVGHSLGGGIAVQFAYQYPERTERLVLVASGGFGEEVSMLFRAASLPGSGPAIALAAWKPIVELGTALTKLFSTVGLHGTTDLEEIGRAYAMLSDRAARTAFLTTLRSVVDFRGQRVSALGHVDVARGVPSMLVWGTRDRLVPHIHAHRLRQLLPDTQLELFEGAGHFPHRDDPDRFVAVIDGFLDQARRPSARATGSGSVGSARAARTSAGR